MPKAKVSIVHRFVHFFSYHPWLKLIALALSVIVWLYVSGEMERSEHKPVAGLAQR